MHMHSAPSKKAQSELNRWFQFSSSFDIRISCLDSCFTIELNRLLAQGAVKLKRKKPITDCAPISPTQLLMLVWTLSPPERENPRDWIQEDITTAGILAALLLGSLGFRFGEILPKSCLAINRNYTTLELNRIPRIHDLIIYTEKGPKMFHDFGSLEEQRRAAGEFLALPNSVGAFRCKWTKMGWPRFVALTHFHLFNSSVLCVLCRILQLILFRLTVHPKKLESNDFLLCFPYKRQWRPVTFDLVVKILGKACLDSTVPKFSPTTLREAPLSS